MNTIHINCPAKINLTLEILGKRPDGYHELRTVFQAVSLYDELRVSLAERDTFTVHGLPGVPADASNLCLRALELYRRHSGYTAPVAIELHKRIPLQAGLGGGSSDAAGTLLALSRLHGEPVQAPPLADLAADLGSDVAFFLTGGAMTGSGRGEVLEPLAPLREGALVLAKPDAAVSTAEAYGLIHAGLYTDGSYSVKCAACLSQGCALPELASKLYNVFAGPVERLRPQIESVRHRLHELNAQATLLCGSGAAAFGLFADLSRAREAAASLQAEGTWAVAVEPLPDGLQVVEQ